MSGHFSANDDEDDERQQEEWFAGGERSGISVQNPNAGRGPNNLVQGLLRRAAQEGAGGPAQSQRSTAFGGGGHVLGGEGVDSQYLGGAQGHDDDGPAVTRWITFWREGFTVDSREGAADGEYRRYDDPANAAILRQIDSGLAPPEILNVAVNQRVDVQVSQRTNDDYVPPPVKPFSGAGNRLGAPTHGGSTPTSAPAPAPSSSGTAASIQTRFEVDQTQPMTSVQIRLADGTRMVCRMNLTHTVGDLRNFINASRPENLTRAYTIGTTFPNRVLEEDGVTVKDAGVAGSVVVQRWV